MVDFMVAEVGKGKVVVVEGEGSCKSKQVSGGETIVKFESKKQTRGPGGAWLLYLNAFFCLSILLARLIYMAYIALAPWLFSTFFPAFDSMSRFEPPPLIEWI